MVSWHQIHKCIVPHDYWLLKTFLNLCAYELLLVEVPLVFQDISTCVTN
jgi:hypothetical protein